MEPPLPPLLTRGFPGKSSQHRRREGLAPPALWVLAGPTHSGQLGMRGSMLPPRLRTEFSRTGGLEGRAGAGEEGSRAGGGPAEGRLGTIQEGGGGGQA